MKKVFVYVFVLLFMVVPALAINGTTLVFEDNFTRADSNTVGNGWVEQENAADDILLQSGIVYVEARSPFNQTLYIQQDLPNYNYIILNASFDKDDRFKFYIGNSTAKGSNALLSVRIFDGVVSNVENYGTSYCNNCITLPDPGDEGYLFHLFRNGNDWTFTIDSIDAVTSFSFPINDTEDANILSDSNFVVGLTNFEETSANTTISFIKIYEGIGNVSFVIRDEQTKNIIDNDNVVITFENLLFGNNYNFTVSNGNLTTLFDYGTYRISYGSSNYDYRSYYTEIGSDTNNIDLFLLNSSVADELRVIVRDENFDSLENATVQLLRYYTDTNTYEVVEMERTAFDGSTRVFVQKNEPFYKFRVLVNDVVKLTSIGTLITSQQVTNGINFQINTAADTLGTIQDLSDIMGNVSFNRNTNTFTLTYYDPSGTLTQACLTIGSITNGMNTFVNESCSTSSSATILIPVSNSSEITYIAQTKFINNENGVLQTIIGPTLSIFIDKQNIVGTLAGFGLFLVALFMIGIVLSSVSSPSLAIMAGGVSFAIPALAGFTVFTYVTGLSIMVVATVLAVLAGDKR